MAGVFRRLSAGEKPKNVVEAVREESLADATYAVSCEHPKKYLKIFFFFIKIRYSFLEGAWLCYMNIPFSTEQAPRVKASISKA